MERQEGQSCIIILALLAFCFIFRLFNPRVRATTLILLYCLATWLPLAAQHKGGSVVHVPCPAVNVEAERLADLNLPRYGHSVLLVNGEPTAIGGHTTNFVPTPTLEYYKDGVWHLVQTAFTHDDGCAVELTTGKVLIAGGHKENMGVGQSFEVELYDPITHTSEGFASLDTKRAKPSVLALDGGRAIIAGNWYHKDAIEMYDGQQSFMHVKGVSIGRSFPHILRTAKDDAIIIGGADTIGQQITTAVVDRLRGEPYTVPMFETWRVFRGDKFWPSSHYFVGDESKGDYSYLLPIIDDEGQIAIAKVTNGDFSLLPTDVLIPMSCKWGRIHYYISFLVDRQRQRAYLIGCDTSFISPNDTTRVYVIAIDYAKIPASLTMCYTDVLTDVDISNPLLTDNGDLMLIGGVPKSSFFKPTAATWLIHIGLPAQASGKGLPQWGWLIIIFLALAAVLAATLLYYRHRKKNQVEEAATTVLPEEPVAALNMPEEKIQEVADADEGYAELMQRISQLMEEQHLYLNPDLKITDIAIALGTNRTTISNCINSKYGSSFPQFVNAYRVKHAQELLRNKPDLKIAGVALAAGFSSEASFYRIFKFVTGTTPNDWKLNN